MAEHSEAKARVSALEDELVKAEQDVARLTKRLAEVDGLLVSLDRELGTVQSEVTRLEGEHTEAADKMERSREEIRKSEDHARDLQVNDPVFVSVNLWWEAVVQNNEHDDGTQVSNAATQLIESRNELERVESERRRLEDEEPDTEEVTALEGKLEAAREKFRTTVMESLPFLMKHCADWLESKQGDEGIATIAARENGRCWASSVRR